LRDLLLLDFGRGEVKVERTTKVERKCIIEEAIVEITITDDGILTFSVVAEQKRVELTTVLCSKPVDTFSWRRSSESCDSVSRGMVLIKVRLTIHVRAVAENCGLRVEKERLIYILWWRRVTRLWRSVAGRVHVKL